MASAVTLPPAGEPRIETPRLVFAGELNSDRNWPVWDIAPDGQRFVFTRAKNEDGGRRINVVLHWFDQFRARGTAAAR